MLCKNIIEMIESAYPRCYALSWDNVGLLAGSRQKEVKKIYVALDADDEVVEEAVSVGADMLITHHPLIFSGMKSVTDDDFIGRRIIKMIENKMAYYAMHTNYDVLGMADLAADKLVLGKSEVLEETGMSDTDKGEKKEGIGRIGFLKTMTLAECAKLVKEAFSLEYVKVFGGEEKSVSRVAICPGAGKSVLAEALKKGAQVLITGDIDHHAGIDAAAQGLMVIDAGHYGLEHIFIQDIKQFLEKGLPGIEIIPAPVRHPFHII